MDRHVAKWPTKAPTRCIGEYIACCQSPAWRMEIKEGWFLETDSLPTDLCVNAQDQTKFSLDHLYYAGEYQKGLELALVECHRRKPVRELYDIVARFAMKLGKQELALVFLQKIVDTGVKDVGIEWLKINLYRQFSMNDDLIFACRAYLAQRPNEYSVWKILKATAIDQYSHLADERKQKELMETVEEANENMHKILYGHIKSGRMQKTLLRTTAEIDYIRS